MRKIMCIVIVILSTSLPIKANNNDAFQQQSLCADEARAKDLAFNAYIAKQELQILAEETTAQPKLIVFDFAIPHFADIGDELWEVHVEYFFSQLRAMILINCKTEQVHFITKAPKGSDEEGEVRQEGPILKDKTLPVTKPEAERIALEYYKKMQQQEEEVIEEFSFNSGMIRLGYDIRDFSRRGEQVWEVRILKKHKTSIQAILWVHFETKKVYTIIAPWTMRTMEE